MARLPNSMANEFTYWRQKHVTHSLPAAYSTFDTRYDQVKRRSVFFDKIEEFYRPCNLAALFPNGIVMRKVFADEKNDFG